jgi:hypothetical protein
MTRLRIVLLLSLVLTTTAASSSGDFDVRYLLATVGIFFLIVSYRKLEKLESATTEREKEDVRWRAQVDGALWGPEDGNGKHNVEAGLVAQVNRFGQNLPRILRASEEAAAHAATAAQKAEDAASFAATAASAAKTAQALLLGDHERIQREREDHDPRQR